MKITENINKYVLYLYRFVRYNEHKVFKKEQILAKLI